MTPTRLEREERDLERAKRAYVDGDLSLEELEDEVGRIMRGEVARSRERALGYRLGVDRLDDLRDAMTAPIVGAGARGAVVPLLAPFKGVPPR